ncbi:MAG: hypothetical protein H0X29_04375 [Parachlamydiaceae bacterium]|nr:hypothetical protein [Parachlamydiaceae bacterium]
MKTPNKLIHVAHILGPNGRKKRLLLRKTSEHQFVWHEECIDNNEQETNVTADNIEAAMRRANYHWKNDGFTTLNCGFRYTLPERDEHGINALFHQMVASYSSMNGTYYDEELGNNCFVQNASIEARHLWQQFKSQARL